MEGSVSGRWQPGCWDSSNMPRTLRSTQHNAVHSPRPAAHLRSREKPALQHAVQCGTPPMLT